MKMEHHAVCKLSQPTPFNFSNITHTHTIMHG